MPAASKRLLVCYVGSAMTVGRSSGLCCELDDSTLDPDLPLCQSSGRYCSRLRFHPAAPARSEELDPTSCRLHSGAKGASTNHDDQFVSPLSRSQNSFKSSASRRASSFFDLFLSLLYYGHLL
ncbi:hypothetical protein GE21DRAFT_1210853 [Neurospora crassa]|nr:hypothetical protein B17C10.100 [imported] - Neurospora crassa [Neurospora crassa]KHE83584.1 hypothetical protein GE21DRAFT_1210853 [Neurospora crassa]